MDDSDPFETRLTFLSLLEKLNASQQSIHKVATYAVRHGKVAEDLYRCLLDELEQASINARLNLVSVLDRILYLSQKARFTGYHELTRNDLARIIAAVVPNTSKGNVNVANTQKIVSTWRRRGYFQAAELDEAEKPLREREASSSSQPGGGEAEEGGGFSKEDMLRRMEEDRERHKRFKEDLWIRPSDESLDAEFQQLWDSTEALVPETDYEVMMLQNMLRLPHYAWHMMLSQRPGGGGGGGSAAAAAAAAASFPTNGSAMSIDDDTATIPSTTAPAAAIPTTPADNDNDNSNNKNNNNNAPSSPPPLPPAPSPPDQPPTSTS